MIALQEHYPDIEVVPHVGTWIEITYRARMQTTRRSCLT